MAVKRFKFVEPGVCDPWELPKDIKVILGIDVSTSVTAFAVVRESDGQLIVTGKQT